MVARHLGRGASYIFAAATAVAIAGLGAGVALLGFGPLSLDFIADDMAAALQRQVPGYEVAIGGAALIWDGERRGLAVRLDDVRFDDRAGEAALGVPTLAVQLDRRALLTGELRPSEVAVDGARIAINRRADGRLSWRSASAGDGNWQALLDQMVAEGAGLDVIAVRHATVTLADEASGGRVEVRDADLTLARDGGAIRASLNGAMVLNGRESPIDIQTAYQPAAAFSVAVRFAGLRPGDAAAGLALPEFADLLGIDVPVDGELAIAVGADGSAERVRFDLRAGAGTIDAAGLPVPANLLQASATGSVDLAAGRVTIAALSAALADGVNLTARGELTLAEAGLGADLVARLNGLAADQLASYWPADMAQGARRWVTANIRGGTVSDAELRIQAAPGELAAPPRPDIVRLSFSFEGVGARYWEPLPVLTDGRGSASLDLQTFDLRLRHGRVGRLEVGDGTVHIANLQSPKKQVAEIEFVAKGSAADSLALLDREPLGFAGDLDLTPAEVGGDASVWAAFSVPLRNRLTLDDIGYRASAVLSRFAVPQLFGRYRLDGGELSLTVDDTGISAEGTAAIAGLPTSLSWRRDFGVASSDGQPVYPDRYAIAGTADVAAFRAIGLDLTALGQGPVGALVNLWISDTGALVAAGRAELAATDLTSMLLRWRKPPGTPAEARFRLSTDSAGLLRLDDLVFVSGDDLALASADFGPGAALRRLYLPTLRLGGQDLAATLTFPQGDGAIQIDVAGRVLDARPFLADDGAAGAEGGVAADLALHIEQMHLGDETTLTGAVGTLAIVDGALDRAELAGRLNRLAPVRIAVAGAVNGERDVVLTSDDAGKVLRALQVFEDAEGGSLTVRGRVPAGEGPTVGHLSAAGVQVRKAPLLAQILSLGSISGIQDVLDGGGMVLREVELPFTLSAPELKVEDGRALGPDIGLTIAGRFDRERDEMAFAGVLVPTYTLNKLLGNIPLIGDILIGRQGEGVFAVSYRVDGPADEPNVAVNPLTALAPGIFRRLVEGLLPTGAAAGADTPASERERPQVR